MNNGLITAKSVDTIIPKFFTFNGVDKYPLIQQGKFNNELDRMLCKEVEFRITTDFGSLINGRGTLVFGAGGNTKEIILITDDREMNRKCDMRFTLPTIEYALREFKIYAI